MPNDMTRFRELRTSAIEKFVAQASADIRAARQKSTRSDAERRYFFGKVLLRKSAEAFWTTQSWRDFLRWLQAGRPDAVAPF